MLGFYFAKVRWNQGMMCLRARQWGNFARTNVGSARVLALTIALVNQLAVSPAFSGDDFANAAREFSIVCPSAVFEPNKLDGLLKKRGFAEADRDGDAESEVVSFKHPKTNLGFEFSGSPASAQIKKIYQCSLFLDVPTPVQQLTATFGSLMRDPRFSGMQKSPERPVAGIAELRAKQDTKAGCLSLTFMSQDTSDQKTTQLSLGRSSVPCKDIR